MERSVTLPGLPVPLHWQLPPESWHVGDEGELSITAGAGTDLFVDPQGAAPALNAPRLLARLDGDFQLSARVTVAHAATFDAGVLALYANDAAWAKLCFERSPQGDAVVVSVVTRGRSDDANAFVIDGRQAWLRVSRVEPAWAFHASTDGVAWQFVRHFPLEPAAEVAVGFLAQSPTGPGCTAVFDRIACRAHRMEDLRSGA